MGSSALFNNTSGSFNTAVGGGALFNNRGFGNIGVGAAAGEEVVNANNVICIGADGQDVSNSCYIGQIYSNIQTPVGTDPDYGHHKQQRQTWTRRTSLRGEYRHDIQLDAQRQRSDLRAQSR